MSAPTPAEQQWGIMIMSWWARGYSRSTHPHTSLLTCDLVTKLEPEKNRNKNTWRAGGVYRVSVRQEVPPDVLSWPLDETSGASPACCNNTTLASVREGFKKGNFVKYKFWNVNREREKPFHLCTLNLGSRGIKEWRLVFFCGLLRNNMSSPSPHTLQTLPRLLCMWTIEVSVSSNCLWAVRSVDCYLLGKYLLHMLLLIRLFCDIYTSHFDIDNHISNIDSGSFDVFCIAEVTRRQWDRSLEPVIISSLSLMNIKSSPAQSNTEDHS